MSGKLASAINCITRALITLPDGKGKQRQLKPTPCGEEKSATDLDIVDAKAAQQLLKLASAIIKSLPADIELGEAHHLFPPQSD